MGDILTREGPVQDSYRAGEHALHGAVRATLREYRPLHSHRFFAGNVSPNDGRFYTSRTVGLHPRLLREQVAGELLAEILYHVVALVLTMYQHIQIQFFL